MQYRQCSTAIICIVLFTATSVCAEIFGDFSFRANVFGSLTAATQDSDVIGFLCDNEQRTPLRKGYLSFTNESNIGIQFTAETSKMRGVVQFVGRDRIDDDFAHLIGYAYTDFDITRSLTFRTGKIPFEHYLNSDTRAVGYTRLWLRPVAEFYTLLFTESFLGLNLKYTTPLNEGWFNFIAFGGKFDSHLPTDEIAIRSYSYDPLAGAVLSWETNNSKFFTSYMWATIKDSGGVLKNFAQYWGFVSDILGADGDIMRDVFGGSGSNVHYFAFGCGHDVDAWRLQSEVSYFLFPALADMKLLSGYISVGYQIEEWTPYIVLAGMRTGKDTIHVNPALSTIVPQEQATMVFSAVNTVNDIAANQFSISLGVRWDFQPGMALKFEWNHFRVQKNGILIWHDITENAQEGGNVNVVSASFDFAF